MLDDARLAAIRERTAPIPIVQTLGFQILEADEGYCKVLTPKQSRYDGIFGSLHGGLLMTIADSVACFAIMTLTGPDEPLTTTDMNIRFLAPCLTDCLAEARVIKCGKTLCPTHVDLFDTEGTHVAVAQVTYIRLDKSPSHA